MCVHRRQGKRGSAGDKHANTVLYHCTSDKEAGRSLRKAENLAYPLNDLALSLDRCMMAPAQIGVETRGQHAC